MAGSGVDASPDLSIGTRTLAVLYPLFAVALVVFCIRMFTRTRPKYRLNASDYTVAVAFVAEALVIALTTVAVAHGFGRPSSYLSADDIEIIGATTFTVFCVAFWASSFARISVAYLLLQITQQRMWRVVLWFSIGIQVVIAVASDIAELVQCRPIRSIWAHDAGGRCFPPDAIWMMAYTFVGIGMVSDVLFAVLPALIIWKLTRSSVEKTLLTVLMGLGVVAMAAGLPKIMTMHTFDPRSPNVVGDMMPLYLWSRVEEILLIIAACAPLLKVPIENSLHRRFGLPRFTPQERSLNTVQSRTYPSVKTEFSE